MAGIKGYLTEVLIRGGSPLVAGPGGSNAACRFFGQSYMLGRATVKAGGGCYAMDISPSGWYRPA
jgi:hypothetical protein